MTEQELERYVRKLSMPQKAEECIEQLRANPALMHMTYSGVPVFAWAVKNNNTRVAEVMFNRGAPANWIHAPTQHTLLHYAARTFNLDMVRLIMELPDHPDINAVSHDTASGYPDKRTALTEVLLDNLNKTDASTTTKIGSYDIAHYLLEHGADPNLCWPAHHCMRDEESLMPPHLLRRMWEKGLDPESRVEGQATLLQFTAARPSDQYPKGTTISAYDAIGNILAIGGDPEAPPPPPGGFKDIQEGLPRLQRIAASHRQEADDWIAQRMNESPAALEAALFKDGKRSAPLMKAVVLRALDPLFEATYWQNHHALQQGMNLLQRIHDDLPAHLRNRIDPSPLLREAPLTHPDDTALVSYAKASGMEVKR